MTAIHSTATSAAAYGEDVDALDSWEDLDVAVEADGADDILIDAYPTGLDPADYELGRPGVGIRLNREQAVAIALNLLHTAGGQTLDDLIESLDTSIDDLDWRIKQGDYADDDSLATARVDRWTKLRSRFSDPELLPPDEKPEETPS